MTKIWQKKTQDEIKEIVFEALDKNVNYQEQNIVGVPATYLDEKVFSQDKSFLKDAPFLSALIKNPNHIGCHTLDGSENFFSGTQEIEKKLIEICAVDILKGEPGAHDGYVASGGTEANIQALWIYRNFYQLKHQAQLDEIAILCSEDSHYSMHKASNVLSVDVLTVKVDEETRALDYNKVFNTINQAKKEGKKYFLVVANMMTTMFGSVDDIDCYVQALKATKVDFKIHVDGAYGGFYYPFSNQENTLNFSNPLVTSVTLDAHKMVQAPYGTGLFLIRKGYMQFANTKEASYIEGEDYTLIGSRSGANAIAIWMILTKNGPNGWFEKIFILQKRAQWLCDKLDELGFEYFRYPTSNIITIKSSFIDRSSAKRFGLVPDNHHDPKWYKVVIMDHVSIEKLMLLLADIGKS